MSRAVSRAARLRQIENILFRHTHGLRVTEIAAACEVNRRTIYRDLELLEESGVPIWQIDGKYGLIRDQYLAVIRLQYHEAVALYIAARLIAKHADEHNPNVISALTKLLTAFPDPLAEYIGRTAETLKNRPINNSFVRILQTIAESWADQRKVRLWYRSPRSGNVHERTLAPYAIEPSSTGGLYVVGYDDWAQDIRTFKLERLDRVAPTDEPYTIPDSFNLSDHLADAWGIMVGEAPEEIILHFSPQVAAYITERVWHPTQTLHQLPDGSTELRLTVSDLREMRPWIRSWGGEVEVIQPEELRIELASEAKKMLEHYTNTEVE